MSSALAGQLPERCNSCMRVARLLRYDCHLAFPYDSTRIALGGDQQKLKTDIVGISMVSGSHENAATV
jgi:hypothetical protein